MGSHLQFSILPIPGYTLSIAPSYLSNSFQAGRVHLARPLRIEYPGAFHHITSRGVARQDIFFDDADRDMFLQLLAQAYQRWGVILHAYCLMTNHYHLEIQTPEGYLSRSLQWVNQNYASYVNRRYQRSGHLFQGRFKSVLVEAEAHLHELTRYIHLNPVRAGMVTAPALYPWSSYPDYLGLRSPPNWLDLQATLSHFGGQRHEQQQRYREFVEQATVTNPLQAMVFGAVLGGEDFVARAQTRLQSTQDDREIAQLVKMRPGVSFALICEVIKRAYGMSDADMMAKSRANNEGRDVAIYLARTYARRSLREIGESLGHMSPSAVSMAHHKIVQRLSQNESLRQTIERLLQELERSEPQITD